MSNLTDTNIMGQIKSLLNEARCNVVVAVNTALIQTYWKTGKIIVEDEQKHNDRAEYGSKR